MDEYYSNILFYEAYTKGRIPFYKIPQYEDINFFQDIARRYSVHSILDVGCGTGRISIPLSESGFEVTGIDNVKTVIEVARLRSSQVDWIFADITQLNLNKRFDLIILGFDLLNHILSQKNLILMLESLHKHLADTGYLIIDAIHPSLNFLKISSDPEKEQLNSIFEDPHGRGLVYVTQKRHYNYSQQLLTLSKDFHFYQQNQQMLIELDFNIFFPKELAFCLNQYGFSVEKIMGDFDGDEFNDDSSKMIFICKKLEH